MSLGRPWMTRKPWKQSKGSVDNIVQDRRSGTTGNRWKVLLARHRVSISLNHDILFRQEQLTQSKYAFVSSNVHWILHKYIIDFIVKIDCPQSPIFSWDRRDIVRLTVNGGILIFKCTEGAGVGDYRPHPLSRFDTYARWQPVTKSPRSRPSYGKIEDCE